MAAMLLLRHSMPMATRMRAAATTSRISGQWKAPRMVSVGLRQPGCAGSFFQTSAFVREKWKDTQR